MDSNSTGIIVEDLVDESDFTAVSSIGIDMKQIVDKIQKLEDMIKKMTNDNEMANNGDQSTVIIQMIWQMGKEMGKFEIKFDEMNKENAELKNGIVKLMKALEGMRLENEGLKEKVGKLVEENGKMLDENVEKGREFEEMKKEIGGLNEELNKLAQEFALRANS